MNRLPRKTIPAVLSAATLLLSGTGANAQEMPVLPEPGSTPPGGLTATEASAPEREIRMLPAHKRALLLKQEERNPYSRRTPEIEIVEAEDGEETESDRIRLVLTGLAVSGRTYGPKGIRILAGDIIFETGRLVPQVLEEQSEILMVESVTEDKVILRWIDPETGELTGKRLPLTYDLSPKVNYILAGQTARQEGEKGKLKFGVRQRRDGPGAMAEEPAPSQPDGATAENLPDGISAEILRKGQ